MASDGVDKAGCDLYEHGLDAFCFLSEKSACVGLRKDRHGTALEGKVLV